MADRSTGRATVSIGLALYLAGFLPARAQRSGDGPAVGLPSPSEIAGPLVRRPDGQIVVAPAPSSDAPAATPAPARAAPPSARPKRTPAATAQRTQSQEAVVPAPAPSSAHGAIITRQIANAPGWQRSRRYVGGDNFTSDRVLAGPGWAAGSPGSFTSGAAVYLWIDATAGAASSAASGNGPQSCPTPGTSTVADGGITWKCLVQIDYNTISAFNYDDAPWQTSHAYHAESYVVTTVSPNPPAIYRLSVTVDNAITPATPTCTSAPSGSFNPASDGTCLWDLVMSIGGANYSSQAGYIPKQQWTTGWPPNGHGGGYPDVKYVDNYVANVWYGGLHRQEYVDGANGETDPIAFITHASTAQGGGEIHPTFPTNPCVTPTWPVSISRYCNITIKAQDTDGFGNNPNARSSALAYNPANGVSIRSASAVAGSTTQCNTRQSPAFSIRDLLVTVYDIQTKANPGMAIDAICTQQAVVSRSILDAVGGPTYLNTTYFENNQGVLVDSLVIFRGTTDYGWGVQYDFNINMYNTTVVNLGTATHSVCVGSINRQVFSNQILGGQNSFKDSYCAGFTHQGIANDGVNSSLPHIARTINPGDTSISISSGIDDFIDHIVVGNESMAVGTHLTTDTTLTVTRGSRGTNGAQTHSIGDLVADDWINNTYNYSSHNAVSNAAQTAPVTFTSWLGGAVYGTVNLAGVGATCGSSSCYGISAANQFVNSSSDFRLKSTADLGGGGAAVGLPVGLSVYQNADIFGTARPQSGKYDIGAFQTLITNKNVPR